ncbi:hypothetical protein [Terribacillus saccharophilus]|uniref:hypothetical protein n=1 Tax=Terribacillus saccharophilus TaxID=361277 RepID=UPI003D2CDE95
MSNITSWILIGIGIYILCGILYASWSMRIADGVVGKHEEGEELEREESEFISSLANVNRLNKIIVPMAFAVIGTLWPLFVIRTVYGRLTQR